MAPYEDSSLRPAFSSEIQKVNIKKVTKIKIDEFIC